MPIQTELLQLHAMLTAYGEYARAKGSTTDRVDLLIRSANERIERNPAAAQAYFEVAARQARKHRLHAQFGYVQVRLAYFATAVNRIDAAYLMANEARLAGQSVNAWPVIAGARYVIATLRQRVGDYARAEAELHALISSAQAQGDAAREADYYTALGELRLEQGQARGAIGLLLKAHDAYVALDDASASVALNTAAYAYLEAGDAVSALATAEKAWVLCAPHATVLRAYIAHTKADALLALGRTGEAEHMLSLARRLAHECGPDPKLALYMQLTQAGILQAKGAFKDAIAMLCKVEASVAEAAFNMQVRLYQALISVHQVAGDSVAAAVCETKLKALKIGRRNAQASDRNLLERLQERVNEMVGAWYQREAIHAASAAAK